MAVRQNQTALAAKGCLAPLDMTSNLQADSSPHPSPKYLLGGTPSALRNIAVKADGLS